MAGAVVDVLPARRAPRVRPGVSGRVDREPQPAPPGARVPHLRGIVREQPGQRLFQQPVIDHVVFCDPLPGRWAVHGLRQFRGQQEEQLLVINPPGRQRVIQRAVTAGELRFQAQLHQRRHRMIGAQNRVSKLEQRVCPPGQAGIQPGAEFPQRQEPVNGSGELGGLGGCRRQQRELTPAGQRRENMVVQRLLL